MCINTNQVGYIDFQGEYHAIENRRDFDKHDISFYVLSGTEYGKSMPCVATIEVTRERAERVFKFLCAFKNNREAVVNA